MSNVLKRGWFPLVFLCLAMFACDDEEAGSGEPTVEPTGRIVDETALQSAVASVEALEDTRTVIVVVSARSRLPAVPASEVGGVDLSQRRTGVEGNLSVDLDLDGTAEAVYVFADDVNALTFLLWSESGTCNLAFTQGGTTYHLFGECDGAADSAVLACQRATGDGATACDVCESGVCEACETDGDAVYCIEEQPEPTPEPEPDMGGREDIPSRDEGVEDTTGVEDLGGDDVGSPALCGGECMSQSGAMCCTTCGCDSSVVCRPLCPDGYNWDCELNCCFDIELGCFAE